MKKMIAASLVLSLLLAGCVGGIETKNPSKPALVTLNVVTSYGGDDGNRANFEAAVEAFTDATGVKVNDGSSSSNEEWKNTVMTDFMTGSEPDVLFYFTNADADPFINAGKVVPIEEIREAYPDYAANMKQSMMAQAADGRHYAVPSTGYWETLFVNRAVLDACGVAVPGSDYTWEQFLRDCETIKAHGYTPIACSLFEIPHYWFEFAVMNNGSSTDHKKVPALDGGGHLILDETAQSWIAALEDIKLLYDRGFFPENTLNAADAETVELFGDGKAAFLVDGSWKVGYFAQKYPDKLEDFVLSYVPGKGQRSATEAIGGISMGYFITRKAWDDPGKREAAVAFVSHMTSEEVLSTFVTTEITALVDGIDRTGLDTIQQSAADAVVNLTELVGAVQDEISSEAKSILFAGIQKVVSGELTPQEAIEAALIQN